MAEPIHNTFNKNIILPNEQERVDALRRYHLLGTYAEKSFVNIANLVAEIFQTSIAMISLVDAENVSFPSSVGMSSTMGPRGESFCSLTVLSPEVNVVEDALQDPVVARNPLVCGDFGLRFYAGAPLVTHDGYLIGTVCLVDTKPRKFSDQDKKILEGLARIVMEQIELRLSNLLDNERLTKLGEFEHAENDRLTSSQTELKLAMEQVRQSESRFQNLIRDATFGIIVLTGEEMLVEIVNNVYAKLIGRTAEDLLGTKLFTLIPETEAYFRPLIDQVRLTGKPLDIYNTPYTVHHNGVRIDGYLNAAYQPYRNNDGSIAGVMVFTQDVTDQVMARFKLKEADEMASMAISAAKLGAWHIEPVTKALVYNSTLANIFGYNRESPMTYDEAIKQVSDEDRPKILAAIDKAITEGGDYDITYQQFRFNDQELIWLRSFGKISADLDGNFTVFSGFVMDVTEQKKDEQRKNDFIGMVSHELKTPLTSLQAIIQVANLKMKDSKDTFLPGAMERAYAQVKRMSNMINGFLNISRLESGKIFIEKSAFDLDQLIKEVIEDSTLTSASHNVKYNGSRKIDVFADRDKISSVISNLLSNAIKYSYSDKEINLTLSTDGQFVTVGVADEGIGVKNEDLTHIFDRYYRVKDIYTQHISGFGIGLYLSAEIIDRHHGKIWAESVIAKGSTFYFSLPL
ncbi:PAS domain S-box protein [Mucilaginibacter sp. JRF]|uniref:ATP-binding protein n=1 Tax=Mucilaginibacter sp. JRF TaxID=2780088 RepID=UPI00187EA681|nr:ATP-binding protein [Mucilaginibacter sp. JRF]MBE9586670.1 PAS domain S-box protein [Mucilaginibacter sp. JRF]